MKYDEIYPRLNRPVPKPGGGYMAFCPSHPDGTQHGKRSLSVDNQDGEALIHCFAGCKFADIIEALGITPEQNDLSSNEGIIYDYRDAAYRLVYQVVRQPGKQFRQRRPDGNGGYIWNLKGVSPLLYRLPETLEAVKQGRHIFLVEGEKDANNLAKLGLVATTNSGGAGKWDGIFSGYLAGANVVILPDNDEPGRKHADAVAKSLTGRARSVKVINLPGLPEKGDVSDWLTAGGTGENLKKLVLEAQIFKSEPDIKVQTGRRPEVVCLADVEPEDVDWLWQPYIPKGKLTLLEGDPGVGKTWLALQLAAIVSKGDPFPDASDGRLRARRDPGNVVYLSAEDGIADTLVPRLGKAEANLRNVFTVPGCISTDPKTGEVSRGSVTLQDVDVLHQAMEKYKPSLLVVDPLQAYLGADVDMNRANAVRPVLAGLANLAEEFKIAVLLIRHLGKSQQDRSIYRGLGSIDFMAAARSALLAGVDPQDPDKRALIQEKNSLAETGPSMGYELREGVFYWTGKSDLTAAGVMAPDSIDEETGSLDDAKDFLQEILAKGPVTAKEAFKQRDAVGITKRTLERAKSDMKVHSFKNGSTWYWELDEKYRTPEAGDHGDLPSNPSATREIEHYSRSPRGDVHINPETLGMTKEKPTSPTSPSQGVRRIDLECDDRTPTQEDDEEVNESL